MARCGWRVDGGVKYYHPECWGGLYGLRGCYCPRAKKGTEQRIAELEQRVKELEIAIAEKP